MREMGKTHNKNRLTGILVFFATLTVVVAIFWLLQTQLLNLVIRVNSQMSGEVEPSL